MSNTTDKPGWQSTEFWISFLVTIGGLVLASGLLPEGSMAGQIIGSILTIAAQAGYTTSRTLVKKNGG